MAPLSLAGRDVRRCTDSRAIGAVGMAHARAVNQHYPGFTELWLSGLRNNPAAADLGVVNHQGSTKRYLLVLRQGHKKVTSWNLALSNGQAWQQTVAISSGYATSADLYLPSDATHPYRHVSTGRAPAAKS